MAAETGNPKSVAAERNAACAYSVGSAGKAADHGQNRRRSAPVGNSENLGSASAGKRAPHRWRGLDK